MRGLFIYPDDDGNIFLRNVKKCFPKTSHLRQQKLEFCLCLSAAYKLETVKKQLQTNPHLPQDTFLPF
jgi:hypothetical protein